MTEIEATGSASMDPALLRESRTIFKIEVSDAEAVIVIAKREANAVAIAEHGRHSSIAQLQQLIADSNHATRCDPPTNLMGRVVALLRPPDSDHQTPFELLR